MKHHTGSAVHCHSSFKAKKRVAPHATCIEKKIAIASGHANFCTVEEIERFQMAPIQSPLIPQSDSFEAIVQIVTKGQSHHLVSGPGRIIVISSEIIRKSAKNYGKRGRSIATIVRFAAGNRLPLRIKSFCSPFCARRDRPSIGRRILKKGRHQVTDDGYRVRTAWRVLSDLSRFH